MNKSKALKTLFYIVIILLALKACIKADIPKQSTTKESTYLSIEQPKYPGPFETKTINGKDYIVARGNIGKYGGTLYSSTIGEGPKTFNPWNAKDATSSEFGGLMFDGLTTTDAYTGEAIPLLAKSISIDKSGKIYTVTLRKGLQWSDGKPITADDVVYTWNNIILAGFGNTSTRDSSLIEGIPPKIEKINRYTIKFSTPKPFAPFLRQLSASIAPKHIFVPVVNKGKEAFDGFWGVTTKPEDFVVSGKFKLAEYVPAQRVKFVRNPNYYMVDKKGNKLPYLDKYVVYVVGDLNNEVLKFEANEIDILGARGNNVARFKEMEKNSDYKMYNLGPNTGTLFIAFNLNDRKNKDGKYYVDPIKQKWFNDINFRKAIDYAIDRESMVANILSGVGSPLYTAESLPSIYLNEKLKNGHKRNIDKAKELLSDSGFILNEDNILEDKDGNIVEINLLTNAGNTERESTGVMLKEDLEELGIKVNFKPIEFNVLVGKLVNTLDWEMIIIGLTGSAIEPHNGKNVWHSNGALHMFNMRKDYEKNVNILNWEKELDKIFEMGAQTIKFEDRKKIYDRYQEIVYTKKPVIYLYSGLTIYVIRDKFGNIQPTQLGGALHNLEEIYVK